MDALDVIVSKPLPRRSLLPPTKYELPPVSTNEQEVMKRYISRDNKLIHAGLAMVGQSTNRHGSFVSDDSNMSIRQPRKYTMDVSYSALPFLGLDKKVTSEMKHLSMPQEPIQRGMRKSVTSSVIRTPAPVMNVKQVSKIEVLKAPAVVVEKKVATSPRPAPIVRSTVNTVSAPRSGLYKNPGHSPMINIVKDVENSDQLNQKVNIPVEVPQSSLSLLKEKMRLRSQQPSNPSSSATSPAVSPQVSARNTENNLNSNSMNVSQPQVVVPELSALKLLKSRMQSLTVVKVQPNITSHNALSSLVPDSLAARDISKTGSASLPKKVVARVVKEAEVVVLESGSVSVGGYQYDPSEANADVVPDLEPCPHCDRKFNANSLEKHKKICRKVFVEKKVEESEEKEDVVVEKVTTKWKNKSSSFRDAMKAAREYNDAIKKGIDPPPPPKSQIDEDAVQCPHCSRRFAPTTAERHIPHCANTRAKPTMLTRGAGKPATNRK